MNNPIIPHPKHNPASHEAGLVVGADLVDLTGLEPVSADVKAAMITFITTGPRSPVNKTKISPMETEDYSVTIWGDVL